MFVFPITMMSSGPSGYTIENAAVFNDNDSDYLIRTPPVSGNLRTWTFSFWAKRTPGLQQQLFGGNDGTEHDYIGWHSDDVFRFRVEKPTGAIEGALYTSRLFRDPTGWIHVVCVCDTTNTTAGDRMKLYFNGVEETAFGTDTNPSLYFETVTNTANEITIGANTSGSSLYDGYLAEIHHVDGAALAATDFGEFDDNGVWVPIEYDTTTTTRTFISRTAGTEIGDLTNGGGLAAAFDGNYSQINSAGAHKSGSPADGYIGKDWGSGVSKTITGFYIKGSSDDGIIVPSNTTTIKLYGSASAPSNGTNGTLLATTTVTDATNVEVLLFSGITTTTAYRYHWLYLDSSYGNADIGVTEIEFYEQTTGHGTNGFHLKFDDSSLLGKNSVYASPSSYVPVPVNFDGSNDYLTRGEDLSGPNADSKVNTFSFWVKFKGGDGSLQYIYALDGGYGWITKTASNIIEVEWWHSSGLSLEMNSGSTTLKADGAWHHVMGSCDVSSSAAHLYIDGVDVKTQVTLSDNNIDWTQPDHVIGARNNTHVSKLNGDLADFYFNNETYIDLSSASNRIKFIDANKLPVSLGSDGSTPTGSIPRIYLNQNALATWHTNAGDGGGFTENGALTAGSAVRPAGVDFGVSGSPAQVTDTPTDSADDNIGNYATLNPLDKHATYETLSNGNLKTVGSNPDTTVRSTIALGTTGKWYWEMTANDTSGIYTGVCLGSKSWTTGGGVTSGLNNAWQYNQNAKWYGDGAGSGATYGNAATWTTNDVIGVAYDATSGTIWCSKNDSWIDGNGTDSSGTVKAEIEAGTTSSSMKTGIDTSVPIFASSSDSGSKTRTFNFGQTAFAGSAPSGFSPLATFSMAAPAISDPSKHFETIIYEGTGAELSTGDTGVAALDFQPDLVWIKNRDQDDSHMLYDSVRGATKDLHPDNADAETTTAQTLKSFDANGFTLGTDVQVNTLNESYVAWCWKAGGTPSANNTESAGSSQTAGSVKINGANGSSAVGSIAITKASANTTAGFSIVAYEGLGSAGTVPHFLTAAPEFILAKNVDVGDGWAVLHMSAGASQELSLHNNGAASTNSVIWDSGSGNPTDEFFRVGTSDRTSGSASSESIIAYCWHSVAGFSKFGSYVGNNSGGNTDGPVIYTGFKPAFVLWKRSDAVGAWTISDNKRNPYNPVTIVLEPNTNNSESAAGSFGTDFGSNFFKIRTSQNNHNANGSVIIYAAFAESPFGGDGVAQAKAR